MMRRCSPFFGLVLTVLFTVAATAEDWTRFRGPGGGGAAVGKGVPLSWTSKENIKWKTALPGHGASSAVILGERVFLTAFSGYGLDAENPGDRDALQLHVICVDRKTGKITWDRKSKASKSEQELRRRVADHGYATSTPTCDETGVYAFFGPSGMVAYDLKGSLLWRKSLGTKTAGFGSAASPILHGDLVIVNASIEGGTMYGLNKKSGEIVWKVDDVVKAWTTPTLVKNPAGETELVVNQKDVVRGFDPDTGEVLWTCEGIHDYVVPCVVAHDGIAYCIGGRSNRCMAIRTGGKGDVTKSHKLWEIQIGANVTSPVYHKGRLYWASDKGIACCVDAKTGEQVYRERLPARGRIYASMTLANERLYVTTRDKGVIVLPAEPRYEILITNTIDSDEGMFNASPAVANGNLFFRTNSYLYCIGK